jgi:hypothetical protein
MYSNIDGQIMRSNHSRELSVLLNVPGFETSTRYVYRNVFVYVIFLHFIASHSVTDSHLVIGNSNGLHDIQVRIFLSSYAPYSKT